MIVFDLRCSQNHVFESWFGSTADYDEQRERGLVQCPLCGDSTVEKAVMAPNVAPKGNSRPEPMPAGAAPSPEQVKVMLAALAAFQAKVESEADYVGDRFVEEARAIHYGETEERPIYGEATIAEAQELREEGIAVAPLPLPLRRRNDA